MRNGTFYLSLCLFVLLMVVWLAGTAGLSEPGWAASLSWTDLDGPTGGPAQALALNPDFPDDPTVVAGGASDLGHASWAGVGIFRSLDGGVTWPDHGGPPAGAVFDVAFSPAWRQDGFALAGLWDGVWSTRDRGATWQQLSSLERGGPAFVTAVAVNTAPGGERTFLAGGSYGGISRSVDEGATWAVSSGPLSVRRLRFHPTQPTIALAATSNGLWRSIDAGLQWTQVTTPTQIFDVAFAADGSAAYATFSDHIWRSSDEGLTWQPMPGLTTAFLDQIGLSADGAAFFVAARQMLYRYNVATSAFVTVTSNLRTSSYLRLEPSPTFGIDQTLLAGTYDGVWISHDAGATFARSDGFISLPIHALAAASDDLMIGDLFVGSDYGVWRRTGATWQPANMGLGGWLASTITDLALSPAYADDGTIFAAQASTVRIGAALYRSNDRGASWQHLTGAAYIGQIELSPDFAVDGRAFMLADQRILTSGDGGATWTAPPFWLEAHTARVLALSPNFAANQTLYSVGNQAYYSKDGGLTWQSSASPPPIGDSPDAWWPRRLAVGADERLYLSIYRYEREAPYARHDQLWTSEDGGMTWTQVVGAPDLPVAALAVGPGPASSGILYLSVFDDNEFDDNVIAPDLYISRDLGVSWQNLGAVPGGAAAFVLTAGPEAPDHLLVGSQGVWLLAAGEAPTATPAACQELLRNRSFENEGEWRIPVTAYSAVRTTERHSHGYWSMRTGIVAAADNVRSYSDFSQDVVLPADATSTLYFQRWSAAGDRRSTDVTTPSTLLTASNLDQFYRGLTSTTGDLHYAMIVEPPGSTIRLLYLRRDDEQAWVDEVMDLSPYAGKMIRLQFGTYNDGAGPLAMQYFDAFRLQACPPAAPTMSPRAWLPYASKPGAGTIPPLTTAP